MDLGRKARRIFFTRLASHVSSECVSGVPIIPGAPKCGWMLPAVLFPLRSVFRVVLITLNDPNNPNDSNNPNNHSNQPYHPVFSHVF